MKKWIPDRKILAGGITMIISWIGLTLLGVDDTQLLATISAGLTLAIQYFVPPSVQDTLKRIDKELLNTAKQKP